MEENMSARYSERLATFLNHWSVKVDCGETSSLAGMDIKLLEIYDEWLRAYEKGAHDKYKMVETEKGT